MVNQDQGTLFIVAAPSGGGKTSLVRALVKNLANIEVSISHTTRDKRAGEENGINYFFIDQTEFFQMINNNEFIEHALVFNHYYGTSKAQINERLKAGIDVVLDIDWQGAQQIKRIFTDAVGIFVIPPSLTELKTRLQMRQRDKEEIIHSRMQKAQDEMSHYPEFDYLIVNDHFEKAAAELEAIVVATRLKIEKQSIKQQKLLSFLLGAE
ncbi:guanylate kinase (plasmid) [Legionella adelaidensis]|uniref:Guanylate kinase n=1 Tax=Legionella adelaidensis TaxID=45056 RepID=A0A0W0R2Z0_9GAMM|nr:guanylate kinase [Legionella adelaidensis]KTC65432.1 guanylate kinase [Legionella adelaidensis]VEH84746.1 guanylate kinase [Legionella adelaidensis]